MAEAASEESLLETQDQALLPIREDIADWLSGLIGHHIGQETLFDELQTGTILCRTAHIIYQRANDALRFENQNSFNNIIDHVTDQPHSASKYTRFSISSKLPSPPKFSAKAQPGSFLARDNAANFITWCRGLGVQDTCMFESEGLVLQKQCRNVLLCLLEVARFAARYGIAPPELIHLEKDIELDESSNKKYLHSLNDSSEPLLMTPPTVHRRKRAKVLSLDNAVHNIVDNNVFRGLIDIERIGEGRYRIERKMVFIRMLRNRHVMVRVGGGWDTLEHYLLTHDTGRFTPRVKLLSCVDYSENHSPATPQRKFHQFRTRIPLRTKQNEQT